MKSYFDIALRGGSRAAAASKMEYFVIIVNGFQPLTIIKKHSILDDAAALDQSLALQVTLDSLNKYSTQYFCVFIILSCT